MGHYLSEVLPDSTETCPVCAKPAYPPELLAAWKGYLRNCSCGCKRLSTEAVQPLDSPPHSVIR